MAIEKSMKLNKRSVRVTDLTNCYLLIFYIGESKTSEFLMATPKGNNMKCVAKEMIFTQYNVDYTSNYHNS